MAQKEDNEFVENVDLASKKNRYIDLVDTFKQIFQLQTLIEPI